MVKSGCAENLPIAGAISAVVMSGKRVVRQSELLYLSEKEMDVSQKRQEVDEEMERLFLIVNRSRGILCSGGICMWMSSAPVENLPASGSFHKSQKVMFRAFSQTLDATR